MTDEHAGYKSVGKIRKHESVNHIKEEWVRGNVHTNSIENYWSLFKRGLIGSFHQVSVKHLERYMAEFDYRFNNRKDVDIFIKTIARMCNVPRCNTSSLLLILIPPYNRLWTPFLRSLYFFLRHGFCLEQSAKKIIEFLLINPHFHFSPESSFGSCCFIS